MAKIRNDTLQGKIKELHSEYNLEMYYFDTVPDMIKLVDTLNDKQYNIIAVDIETNGFSFVTDDMLGIGIAWSPTSGCYFNTRNLSDDDIRIVIRKINEIKAKKCYWNGYFDVSFMLGRYKETVDYDYDGLIYIHTTHTHRRFEYKNEDGKGAKKGFGLKEITEVMLPYGNYETELEAFKNQDMRTRNLKKKQYSYKYIPDEILAPYCIMDCICTLVLQQKLIDNNSKLIEKGWKELPQLLELKHEVTKLYIDSTVKGFKIDRKRVLELSDEFKTERDNSFKTLMALPEIKQAEKLIFRDKLLKAKEKRPVFNDTEFIFEDFYKIELEKKLASRKTPMSADDIEKFKTATLSTFYQRRERALLKSFVSLKMCRTLYKESKFNFGSSIHKDVLFGKLLGLVALEKTETGQPCYNTAFIEHYATQGITFMTKLREYNLYVKGITSFLGTDEDSEKGLWNLSSDEHPYVHANYSICGTTTSRTATSNPCYSQVPSRGILKKIKQCYIVEDGYKIINFDFSNAEMRILAVLSQEPNFLKAFEEGHDLHSFMALKVFKDKMDLPSDFDTLDIKEQLSFVKNNYSDTFRYWAKAVNFGLPYGIQEKGLAKNIGCTVPQAKEILDSYMKSNSKIAEFININKSTAFRQGYVENKNGARIYLNACKGYDPFIEHRKKNWSAISQYRKSTNWIIQSQNAYIMYEAMITFFKEVKLMGLDISLLTTIYDAVYLRVKEDVPDELVNNLLKRHFEVDFFSMPMKIDVEVAKNEDGSYSKRWYDTKELETNDDEDEVFDVEDF